MWSATPDSEAFFLRALLSSVTITLSPLAFRIAERVWTMGSSLAFCPLGGAASQRQMARPDPASRKR